MERVTDEQYGGDGGGIIAIPPHNNQLWATHGVRVRGGATLLAARLLAAPALPWSSRLHSRIFALSRERDLLPVPRDFTLKEWLLGLDSHMLARRAKRRRAA
jgi:hypothetical protein